MISREDYELSYSLFLAEQELYNELSSIQSYLEESVDIISVNEAMGKNVGKYVSKVTQSAQKAWTRFKNKVASKKQIEMLNTEAKNFTDGPEVSFKIANFHTYNLNGFNLIKVQLFDYEKMKDSLVGPQKYLNMYHQQIAKDGKVYKNFLELVDKGKSKVVMDNRAIQPLYKFCTKDFYAYRKSIEADLEMINKSTEVILGESNIIISDSNNSKTICESMLLEAPIKPMTTQASDKMVFSNGNGDVQASGKGQVTYSKAIHVYLQCSMDIVSAKMKILRRIYLDYFQVLDYYSGMAAVKNVDLKDKAGNQTNKIKI